LYNKVYRKTTFGIEDIARVGKKNTRQSKPAFTEPVVQISASSPVLDKHFQLSENIPLLYKKREEEGLEKTIEACKQQIDLALQAKAEFLKEYPWQPLPSHRGYEQFAIILDKQGRFDEAINICEQAKAEGWAGDWDKRIERYKVK
jgi:tetratricopeptide (TPR) repeat protein